MNQAIQTSGESAEPSSGPAVTSDSDQSVSRRTLRCWLLAAALCMVLGRLAGIQGWFVPVQIAGDSMALTMLGEHQRRECPDCAATFRFSIADLTESDELVVCPNCGYQLTDRTNAVVEPGERVWVDRFAHLIRSMRRGELVALRDPLDATRLAVKRVIGLPGERLRIEDGDVFLDSRRWQKSFDELHEVAVLVHDDRFRPANRRKGKALPERWRDESGWSVYHHWRCFASPLSRTGEAPVLDNDSFNQQRSRSLREVTDLTLAGRLTLAGGEQVIVRLTTPAGMLAVIFDAASNTIELRRGESATDTPETARQWMLLGSVALPSAIVGREVDCELAACDRRLFVACDRKLLLVRDESEVDVSFQLTSAKPWGVACVGSRSKFVDRRILRDLYYLGPHDAAPNWTAERALKPGECFLLGDNCPVSVDSRHWPNSGAVPEGQIVGRVLRGGTQP